jgi:hypothetical protein
MQQDSNFGLGCEETGDDVGSTSIAAGELGTAGRRERDRTAADKFVQKATQQNVHRTPRNALSRKMLISLPTPTLRRDVRFLRAHI